MIEKNVYKKWIFPVLAIFLLIAALLLWQYKKQETEYSIIQAIIEELPNYQSEIESWGYEVSILPKMTGEPDNAGLNLQLLSNAFLSVGFLFLSS